jgi:hypothetical protein
MPTREWFNEEPSLYLCVHLHLSLATIISLENHWPNMYSSYLRIGFKYGSLNKFGKACIEKSIMDKLNNDNGG